MHLVDSHCHLDDQQFEAERDEIVERALAAGLKYMLSIGTGEGPPDLEAAMRMAERYDCVYATVGVHPNDSAKADDETFSHLADLLRHPKVRAVGEIGLDFHWGVPRETQVPIFRRQLALAAQAKMPVVIHTRDAWDATMQVLREEWAPTGLPCLMHCFTGNWQQAQECLELGFLLAFGGVLTFPKAVEVREAARQVPAGKILLETDCPYLAPVPFRGKRNEPAYVRHTAEQLAKVRNVDVEKLAEETTETFERVFLSGSK